MKHQIQLLLASVLCVLGGGFLGACEREEKPVLKVFPDEEPQPVTPLLIAPPLPTRASYLALGDSYTIGESVSGTERYPMHLVKALQARGVDLPGPAILAQTGWTVAELMAAMDRETFEPSYELVTVAIGVNNQYRGMPAETFRPELKTFLDRATKLAGGRAERVVMVSIPDWGIMPFAEGRDRVKIANEIDGYNAVCREEAEARGMSFVDITPISRGSSGTGPSLHAADGLHPSGEQYRLWAEQVAPVAASRLAKKSGN